MPDAQLSANFETEASQIAAVRAVVLEQAKKSQFEPTPYEHATEFLESLPQAQVVDNRVRLALEITSAARYDYRPDLSRRALHAAFPPGSHVDDQSLLRKWLTFTAVIEGFFGNVELALKYKFAALRLCQKLNDSIGFCSEWINFATFATGAGLYEDAVQYATVAIEADAADGADWISIRRVAFLSRANALFRLGRIEEAKRDLASCFACITYPANGAEPFQIALAQYLLAEVHLDLGDRSAAKAALHAASTWADLCGVPRYKLQIQRVKARLLAFEGGFEQALKTLSDLLGQANELEAQSGTVFEDIVLDVLHTLERVCREHGDLDGANRWLTAIGEKLRGNATKMFDVLASRPAAAGEITDAFKLAEIDTYLDSRAVARRTSLGIGDSALTDLMRLAASASGIEDPTKEHGIRVARLAGLVACELGLSDATRRGLEVGCLIHDIGKLGVPASILMKQSTLDAGERVLYDAHPFVGAELVSGVSHPQQSVLRNVVRFHHHAYAGSNEASPVGDAIPVEARIAAICDAYDSLVSGRPRRPAISSNEALHEIFEQCSRKFDPKIVEVFVEIVRRLQRTHSNLQLYLAEEAECIEYFAMQRTLRRSAERALTIRAPATLA